MDKKQQMLIGGGVVVVVLIIVAYIALRPSGDGGTTTDTKDGGTVSTSKGGGNMMIPGGPGVNRRDDDDDGGSAPTAAATKAPRPNEKPNFAVLGRPRNDPFYVDWRQLPPPPNVFESVEPIRLASPSITTPPAQPVEIREAPSLRYAGFMSGEGIYAVLEGNGDTEIVQPGTITKEGFKVVSITSDNVLLRKVEGNVIRVQQVAYGDAPPTVGGGRPAGNFGGGNPFGGPGGQFNNNNAGRRGGGGKGDRDAE
jgi:hypothetical protein